MWIWGSERSGTLLPGVAGVLSRYEKGERLAYCVTSTPTPRTQRVVLYQLLKLTDLQPRGCAEPPPLLIHDYRCSGVFGSVVWFVCGYVLGFLRVLGPLLP